MKKILLAGLLCLSTTVHTTEWRQIIQDYVQDCVVQIFSQRAELDICCPWMPPVQKPARGSGFFINAEGHILTNAHVVDQALALWILIPSLGKRFITVELIGICPERDVALLKIVDEELPLVKQALGEIQHVTFGNSDEVCRTDEVLALGYPLGQESLKSTTGVISGREQQWIQIDAAINPGSSGGPLFNTQGQVIGLNAAGVVEAQNVGYIIPINNVKVILSDLYTNRILHKPFLGIFSINLTDSGTAYLKNPHPGGCFVTEVIHNSPLHRAGVVQGDVIYEIDGNSVDMYGQMNVAWSEDKISIVDYVSRIELGKEIELVVYRNGKRLELTVSFCQSDRQAIRMVYPGYEPIDYEIFGGMVVMELTFNHIQALADFAPCLRSYSEIKNQSEPVLVITHIFSSSQLYQTRTLTPGSIVLEINEQPVATLEDFRAAIQHGVENDTYFVIRAADKKHNISDNLLVVLPYQKVLREEITLAQNHHYPISETVGNLLQSKRIVL